MAEPGRGATNAPRDLILTKSLILSKGPSEFHDKASPHTAYRREEAEQIFLSFDVLTAPSASLEILPAPEFPKVDVGGGDNEAAPTNSYTRGSCGRLSLYTFPPETQSDPTYQNHANNRNSKRKTHRRSHTCCFSDNQTKGGRGRRRPRAHLRVNGVFVTTSSAILDAAARTETSNTLSLSPFQTCIHIQNHNITNNDMISNNLHIQKTL